MEMGKREQAHAAVDNSPRDARFARWRDCMAHRAYNNRKAKGKQAAEHNVWKEGREQVLAR